MAITVVFLGLLMATLAVTGADGIGVCYGEKGNNLPLPQAVVDLYKQQNIGQMRIYWPNPTTLQALRGTNIQLMLGVQGEALRSLASDSSAATQWVQSNVVKYPDVKIKYIVVSNEVSPIRNTEDAPFVLPAMQNIYGAIQAAGLQDQIKVTLAFDTTVVENSYPPSHGVFRENVRAFVDPIIQFLKRTQAPVLVNVYPYFSAIYDRKNIKLPYALFTNPSTEVVIDDNGLAYQNLFDAILDSFYAALEKADASGLEIVVSESGWPSHGEEAEDTVENAGMYYQNLINHVKRGSPKKPGKPIETYLFAMFNENLKAPPERENHFGLFLPVTKQPKYQINFS